MSRSTPCTLLAAALCLAGLGACSSKSDSPPCSDQIGCPSGQVCQNGQCVAEPGGKDMASPPAEDLTSPPADLTSPPAGIQFASNKLALPKSRTDSAVDIDGDGTADNRLGYILGLLALQQVDFQAQTDEAVKQGLTVQLFDARPADLSDSKQATVTMRSAKPRAAGDPPAYDGTDRFEPGAEPGLLLRGAINGGALETTLPKDLAPADVQRFRLVVPIGKASLRLDLYGVHLQASAKPTGLDRGQFHGVVRKQDIDTQVIPSIADLLTDQINSAPDAPSSKQLISTFETGSISTQKCQANPADCCATSPKTCRILPEEVKANILVQTLLVPDLQCYDAQGRWKPTPGGATKDCLSVGLGFTAVRAQF